jgi:hypothetical protein
LFNDSSPALVAGLERVWSGHEILQRLPLCNPDERAHPVHLPFYSSYCRFSFGGFIVPKILAAIQ